MLQILWQLLLPSRREVSSCSFFQLLQKEETASLIGRFFVGKMNTAEGLKIIIYDTTLRDGAQTPGVSLTVEKKLRIAQELDEFGIP